MARSNEKQYFKTLRATLKSKLNEKLVFQAINIWVVPNLPFGAGIINWTKEELKEMDRKTRNIVAMYGKLVNYIRDQILIGCTYQEVKEVGGLTKT